MGSTLWKNVRSSDKDPQSHFWPSRSAKSLSRPRGFIVLSLSLSPSPPLVLSVAFRPAIVWNRNEKGPARKINWITGQTGSLFVCGLLHKQSSRRLPTTRPHSATIPQDEDNRPSNSILSSNGVYIRIYLGTTMQQVGRWMSWSWKGSWGRIYGW